MNDHRPYFVEVIACILDDPKGRAFRDLRDRAAYVFVTGCFPTHLRTESNELLRLISEFSQSATSLDKRSGNLGIAEDVAVRLNLAEHPLVKKVREYVADGYRITVSRNSNARRPYGKVFLSRWVNGEQTRISVKSDGSVLDHW